ncbi:hypothetical protein ACFQ73_09065 [Amycolatopsis japonica]|uniref:hypothetical protein n=1 Tax=Amycolatopsis japonica TaxID=208439 RepID=UPI00367037FB
MLLAHALGKVEFVLEVARKDAKKFLPDLIADPYKAVSKAGIDLTSAETLAVVDVVKGLSLSPYAANLQRLRTRWADIQADNNVAARRDVKANALAV